MLSILASCCFQFVVGGLLSCAIAGPFRVQLCFYFEGGILIQINAVPLMFKTFCRWCSVASIFLSFSSNPLIWEEEAHHFHIVWSESVSTHIPQCVSGAWSNMPSSPKWFNSKNSTQATALHPWDCKAAWGQLVMSLVNLKLLFMCHSAPLDDRLRVWGYLIHFFPSLLLLC